MAADPFAQSRNNDPFSAAADQFLPVEEAYQLYAKLDGTQLVLNWNIEPAYYLYRHGFKFSAGDKNLLAVAEIPPGITREDDYFGRVEVYYDQVEVRLPVPSGQQQGQLTFYSQGCADAGLCYPPQRQQLQYDLASGQVSLTSQPSTPFVATAPPVQASNITLWLAMLLAFGGGLILNLMPCVLPILTLKALSFANDHSASHRQQQGWAYTLGVIASFILVASILIALKSAGQAVGWGFQLQSPWFVAALVYLFFTLGLVMSGALLPGAGLMGVGQGMTEQPGFKGSFFTGVLATTVASPCTAPFMGSALGYAITQPWYLSLAVFATLGAGMAFPFLLLSYMPGLQRLLPKPGLWMEHFKELLAFPLYATAIWLLWVVSGQAGSSAVTLILCGCLLIALGTWFSGDSRGSKLSRVSAFVFALALLFSPSLLNPTSPTTTSDSSGIYSADRLADLRAQQQAVFINVTADWCITCIANERIALGTDQVQQAFSDYNITYLEADWTRYDPSISALLEQYQRTGIPLYLLYPADNTLPAEVLPQLLTPKIMLQSLERL
jgi:thiol:disulfide interchange protein DsbD